MFILFSEANNLSIWRDTAEHLGGGAGTGREQTRLFAADTRLFTGLLPVIRTSAKPGQAQPTGNYQLKLPRTASLMARFVATGEATEEARPQSLSPASDPSVSCPPGAGRTEAMVLHGAERSAPAQSRRLQEETSGSLRTSSIPGHCGTCPLLCHPHFRLPLPSGRPRS